MRRLLLATSLVIGLSDSVPAQEWQRDPKIAIAPRLGEFGVRAFANVAWRDVVKSALAHGGKAQKQCYPEQNFCSTWIDYRFGGELWRVVTAERADTETVYKRSVCVFNDARDILRCANFETGERFTSLKSKDGSVWSDQVPR